jgi:hypothetical protein
MNHLFWEGNESVILRYSPVWGVIFIEQHLQHIWKRHLSTSPSVKTDSCSRKTLFKNIWIILWFLFLESGFVAVICRVIDSLLYLLEANPVLDYSWVWKVPPKNHIHIPPSKGQQW